MRSLPARVASQEDRNARIKRPKKAEFPEIKIEALIRNENYSYVIEKFVDRKNLSPSYGRMS